jgi:hypothetical protein
MVYGRLIRPVRASECRVFAMLLSPFQIHLTFKSPLLLCATVGVAALAAAWPGQDLQFRLAAPFMVLFSVAASYLFWRICLTVLARITASNWSKFGYYYSLFVYYMAAAAVPLSIVAIPFSWTDPAYADLPKWTVLLGVPTALSGMIAAGEVIRGNYARESGPAAST